MKLAASNLAWPGMLQEQAMTLLKQSGFTGLEIAPTRVWPDWQGASTRNARVLRQDIESQGFVVAAMQAVLFGIPKAKLFGSPVEQQKLLDHMCHVADLAHSLGAEVVVFGAPGVRDRGDLDIELAYQKSQPILAEMANASISRGVRLCIEPNPQCNGCNFITTSLEGAKLVEQIPGLGLHLDSAAIFLAGEDPVSILGELQGKFSHFHASQPNLGPFVPGQGPDHPALARILKDTGYNKWVSLEMQEQPNAMDCLQKALEMVGSCYGRLLS